MKEDIYKVLDKVRTSKGASPIFFVWLEMRRELTTLSLAEFKKALVEMEKAGDIELILSTDSVFNDINFPNWSRDSELRFQREGEDTESVVNCIST